MILTTQKPCWYENKRLREVYEWCFLSLTCLQFRMHSILGSNQLRNVFLKIIYNLIKSKKYLISFTYSRIWLKFVFLPTVSLHAVPMQNLVLPASFAYQILESNHHRNSTYPLAKVQVFHIQVSKITLFNLHCNDTFTFCAASRTTSAESNFWAATCVL